jgi:LuxR family transcriptional regulator, maltose regulon positive regulatory protein
VPQALLTTKLRSPRPRPDLVARPRLREVFDQDEGRRLTLVSAPAGFGKTTLLGEWLDDRWGDEKSIAWVSLDESDNDPARFLAYLVRALQSVEERIGEGVLASLRSSALPSGEAVVGALINELARVDQEISIVLDDYHLITSEPVHEAVSFLIEHMPENAHLVISGRTDPPLPLARLRARDQMTEIRAADLRFTTEEATAFLGEAMGLALSAGDVAALEEITEGWVAALQLAALSMRDREDISGFVEAFSGSNRHVLDFLAEEVLGRQPEAVREFLLRTSVLESMSAPLCDALTGREDGQQMLERLERNNLFIVALDDDRRWYRYHHLFADFLRGNLGRECPELTGEQHLLACGWYEDNGHLAEAIGHALSAPDHERAALLIEQGIKEAWSRGEGPTVLRWLEALPTEAKRRRPRLITEHALALVLTGRPNDAEPLLQKAERVAGEATTGKDRRYLLGLASAIRSWRARLRGDAPESVELARRALSLLPDEETSHRNFAAVCLGEALRTIGDLSAASEAFAEAAEIGRAAGYLDGTLTGMVLHARVQAERGRLREAEEAYRRALRLLTEEGSDLLPAAGVIHIGLGVLSYERNDLDEAERELNRGMQLAKRAREVSSLVWAYITFSQLKRARGDEVGALETAHGAERVARASGADLQIAIAGAWMVRLRLARGELAEAAAFEQERAANADDAADAARVVDQLASARVLHAQGRHREALPLLKRLREEAEGAQRTGSEIEILVLRALAMWASHEKEKAVGTLTRALTLAEPEGYVRTFVDEGPAIGDLLSATLKARQRGRLDTANRVPARYLAKLLAALARENAEPTADERLAEPPSEREMEVLALIAAGESNPEIARKLYVSTSTVKTHINRLYRKLGARSRTQAVALAREMNLL